MKRTIVLLAAIVTLFVFRVTIVSAQQQQQQPPPQWCQGAYDPKLGTNFAACPGPR